MQGALGGGVTLSEAAPFEEGAISKQLEKEHLCPGGRWRAYPAVDHLSQSGLGCLLKMRMSGLRVAKLIFQGENWSFAFPAGSPGDFDGP